MIEVQMSKDVKEYSPKIVSFLDKRQVVCVLIGGAYAIPAYLFMADKGLSLNTSLPIIIILLLPVVVCGWFKMYGMPFEVFFIKFMIPTLLFPRRRIYESKNAFEDIKPENMTKPGFKKAKRHKMTFKEKKEYKEHMLKYNSSL